MPKRDPGKSVIVPPWPRKTGCDVSQIFRLQKPDQSMQEIDLPDILTPALTDEARVVVTGDWLEAELSPASASWRTDNEPVLRRSDMALRALFLLAYRRISESRSAIGETPVWIDAGRIQPSEIPSLKRRTDSAFGDGFHEAVRVQSRAMVERSPTSDVTDLLVGFSDFIRFNVRGLTTVRGPAIHVIEAIWEDMNIGWFN